MAAAFKIEKVEFSLATGAGPTDVTITGFGTVKHALCFVCSATANDTVTADAILAFGQSDGTNENCIHYRSEDASASTNTSRSHRADSFISIYDNASALEARYTSSFITDGVRLTNQTTSPAAYKGIMILIGGDDVTSSWTTLVDDLGTGTGAVPIDHPTTTFRPTLVFVGGVGLATAAPVGSSQGLFNFGCMIDSGDKQRWVGIGDFDGQGSSIINTAISEGRITGQILNGSSITWSGTGAITSTGITITPSASSGNDIITVSQIEIGGTPDLDLVSFVYDDVVDVNDEQAAFDTSFVLEVGCFGPTAYSNTTGTVSTDMSLGITAMDDAGILSLNVVSEDLDADNSFSKSLFNNAKLAMLTGADDSSVAVESSADSLDTLGFNHTLSTNPAADIFSWALVAGQPTTSGTTMTAEVGAYTLTGAAAITLPASGRVSTKFTVAYAGLNVNSPFSGDTDFSALAVDDQCIYDLLTSPSALTVSMTGDGVFSLSGTPTVDQTFDYLIYDDSDGTTGTTGTVTVFADEMLTAAVGSYTYSGAAATTILGDPIIIAGSGNYSYTGANAQTIYSGDVTDILRGLPSVRIPFRTPYRAVSRSVYKG